MTSATEPAPGEAGHGLVAVTLAAWFCGTLLRALYIFKWHPATAHVYSDMQGYVARAQLFFSAYRPTIADTIFPPGTDALFGALYALDPGWRLALAVQFLLSLGCMALVWRIAYRLYGPGAGAVALGIAALYLPFVHYAGLFLAENPLTFSLLLAFWLLLRAIDAPTPRASAAWGMGAGLAAGVAASFKATVFLPMALTGLLYAIYALRTRPGQLAPLAAATIAGLAVLLAPLAWRCTSLSEGRACLVANNTGLNVLMGHYGEKAMFYWRDPVRGYSYGFGSPTSGLRGFTEEVHLPIGAYDSDANLALARDWIAQQPLEALRLSFRHVWDLFASRTLWPRAPLFGVEWGAIAQPAFWALVLLPALLWLAWRSPAMWRFQTSALPEWLLLMPVLGIALTAFLTQGEARHRVPFDAMLIVLAARGWLAAGSYVRRSRICSALSPGPSPVPGEGSAAVPSLSGPTPVPGEGSASFPLSPKGRGWREAPGEGAAGSSVRMRLAREGR